MYVRFIKKYTIIHYLVHFDSLVSPFQTAFVTRDPYTRYYWVQWIAKFRDAYVKR